MSKYDGAFELIMLLAFIAIMFAVVGGNHVTCRKLDAILAAKQTCRRSSF